VPSEDMSIASDRPASAHRVEDSGSAPAATA